MLQCRACFLGKFENYRPYFVSIWSASYSLKKNSGLGGGVTSFRDQVRTCTRLVHVISRLISLLVDL